MGSAGGGARVRVKVRVKVRVRLGILTSFQSVPYGHCWRGGSCGFRSRSQALGSGLGSVEGRGDE